MTKILTPLSAHVVVHGETRVLHCDTREDFFIDAKSEKNVSFVYEVCGEATYELCIEVAERARCTMNILYRAHEKDAKLRARISVLLQREAQISLDVASFCEVECGQSDVRVFVVFNEGAKATVRAYTRATEKQSVVHEEIRGLAVGETASASFIPELSLVHDDVVATHATSVVKIDERRVAYFLSRGVSCADAERCLVDAFLYGSVS